MKSKTKTRDARPKTPDQILHELAIEKPDEIDVEIIAQYLGATIYHKPLKGCEARIVGYGDKGYHRRELDFVSGSPEVLGWTRNRTLAS